MIVVTGCPRSGTSLMMQLLRSSLGADRIIGEPFIDTSGGWFDRIDALTPGLNRDECACQLRMECPGGYWEHPEWTMGGVRDADPDTPVDSVCKVVGLSATDPQYVDQVIYMLRDPMESARSAARLGRIIRGEDPWALDQADVSPGLFTDYTLGICRYLAEHAPPVLVVELRELCRMPEYTMARVSAFLGEPVAPDGIRQGGGRMNVVTDHGGPWDLAYEMYRLAYLRDWRGVVDAHEKYRNRKAIESLSPEELALIGL